MARHIRRDASTAARWILARRPSVADSLLPSLCRGAHGSVESRSVADSQTSATGGRSAQDESPGADCGGEGESGEKTTHFGFRSVPEGSKSRLVGGVFSSVAAQYDVMNDVMSGGMHRWWKDRLVASLHPFPGMQHIDVAGGTGDISFRVVRAIRQAEMDPRRRAAVMQQQQQTHFISSSIPTSNAPTARVVVCDLNEDMLRVGQQRASEQGLAPDTALEWLHGDAEDLSKAIEDESMDSYSIAFGIRNVTRIDKALKEAYRVLRPGGQFACLELSRVTDPVLRQIYDAYSFSIIPPLGAMIAGDRDSYQYLVESIRKFPPQPEFASMIEQAGFKRVSFENMTFGVVALHTGFKL